MDQSGDGVLCVLDPKGEVAYKTFSIQCISIIFPSFWDRARRWQDCTDNEAQQDDLNTA